MAKISRSRIDMVGGRIDRAVFKAWGETLGDTHGTNTGAAYTINLQNGGTFSLTLNADCTFTFSNPSVSGTACSFTLILKQDAIGGRTVTWPANVKWGSDAAPVLSTAENIEDIFIFLTIDGGARWFGFVGPQNYPTLLGLFAWGKNDFGQLGLRDTVSRSSPVQVSGSTSWSVLQMSPYASAGIKNGTLWTWGRDSGFGELGLGAAVSRSSPTQVGTLATWSTVSIATSHALATKTDGTLWAWGRGSYGKLGLGNTTSYSSPVQVGTLATWSTVGASSGGNFSAALKTDGTLWAWGGNYFGRLGLGDTASRSSPTQVGNLTNWSSVAVGESVLAVKTNGTLWSWGSKFGGLHGTGDYINRSSPVQVGALTTWSKVAGSLMAAAIKTDGTLWAWGDNGVGELGLGDSYIHRSSPVQVGTLATWADVAAGNQTIIALKTDNTIWVWGRNTDGTLGLGDTNNRSSPVQLGSQTWGRIEDPSNNTKSSLAVRT